MHWRIFKTAKSLKSSVLMTKNTFKELWCPQTETTGVFVVVSVWFSVKPLEGKERFGVNRQSHCSAAAEWHSGEGIMSCDICTIINIQETAAKCLRNPVKSPSLTRTLLKASAATLWCRLLIKSHSLLCQSSLLFFCPVTCCCFFYYS